MHMKRVDRHRVTGQSPINLTLHVAARRLVQREGHQRDASNEDCERPDYPKPTTATRRDHGVTSPSLADASEQAALIGSEHRSCQTIGVGTSLDRTWRIECLCAETTPYEALRKMFPIEPRP